MWFSFIDDVMYKGDQSKAAGTVTVEDDSIEIWRANEPSEGVGFPSNTWRVRVISDPAFATGEQFTVEVGSYDGATFTAAGNGDHTFTGDGDKTIFSTSITGVDTFNVPTSDYLALRVTNPAAGTADLVAKTGSGWGYLESGASDPGYPVPELQTIVLMSVGLLALVGYVGWRRRRRKE